MAVANWKEHFSAIYATQPDQYERLVAAEDAFGELALRIEALAVPGTRIVDIGAGTGRLAAPLCRKGVMVHAVDRAAPMLEIARERLGSCGGDWSVSVADARELPIGDGWTDCAVAGWVYGHFTEWHPGTWPRELERALSEMNRVVRSGGIEIVIDTLGTAVEEPAPPNPALAAYHEALERAGFSRSVLRTDYQFASVDEAFELLDWFFGLGEWVRQHDSSSIPEFTGWWERHS